MHGGNHRGPCAHRKRQQDGDKRCDFHDTPLTVIMHDVTRFLDVR